MKAILLAAGIGKRLKPITDTTPKCLIEINGRTILERFLDSLLACGIDEIVMVVGHLRLKIGNRIGNEYQGVPVRYILNNDYTRGSVLSLWCARNELKGDVLVMDADVLFHPALLKRLVESSHENCLLMDTDASETGEEMMLGAVDGRVTQVARHLDGPHDARGEGVGFLKLGDAAGQALREKIEAFVTIDANKDREYEDALQILFQSTPIGYETVDGLPWTELDFTEDIRRAEQEIVPKIESAS